VLLLIVFGSLVYGVSGAIQGIEPRLLWPPVLLGLLLGWVLACSRLAGWLAAAVSAVTGVILVLGRLGQLGGILATLAAEAANLVRQMILGHIPPDLMPLQAAWMELVSGSATLMARLYSWTLNLTQARPAYDPIPVAILWSLALWATVVWASWALRRRVQPVLALVPAVALLASTLAYVGGQAFFLLPMLGSTLILKASVEQDGHRREWTSRSVAYASRVRANTLWLALASSMALMVLAALTPSISVYRIADLLRSLSRTQPSEQDIGQSLGLEPKPGSVSTDVHLLDARRAPGLPTRHLIGSGPELSRQVVMVVKIESTPAGVVSDEADQPGPNYYWRGLTYDRYTDRGWSTEYAGRVKYAAGEAAIPPSTQHRRFLRQSVRLVGNGSGLLYTAGALVTADQEFRIAWRSVPDAEGPGDAYGALIEADTYRADSLLPVVGEADLRAAGQDYPAWVVERYLDLPDSVPDRVLALARDLTARELTPYDRALALERHLRRFPYTLEVPAPPPDQDPADFFLFDLQRGYCDYYATAMAVLARAAGLPSRLVTGYVSGAFDAAGARYVVTEAEAHAWPEIYFVGYGWIEFEPTAGRPALQRPAGAPPEVPAALETPTEPITAHRTRVKWAWLLGIGGGLLVLALGGVVAWSIVDRWQLGRLSPEVAVSNCYWRLYRYGRWFAVLSRTGDTPYEFAAAFAHRLADLAENRRWGALLIPVVEEIKWLADLCTRALYSRRRPGAIERAQVIQTWGRLRRRLWLARLLTGTPFRHTQGG
jgi:transglutaminase-like putative cysteine protease